MAFISKEDIFDKTQGGLDVILTYYPQADVCVRQKNAKFKMRGTEKTASATLKQLPDGNWVVTDFGGDAVPRNCIGVVMMEENCDFKKACDIIAMRFNIIPAAQAQMLLTPTIEYRDALLEEEEGTWLFDVKDFTEKELATLFADKVREGKEPAELTAVCKKYHLHSLASYTIIKNRKATIIKSNDDYPIFMFEEAKFKKIYQPKSIDKSRRFIYYGNREKDYLHGYEQCLRAHGDLNDENKASNYENLGDEEKQESRKEKKLPEIINCSGGSDALNLAALGYAVVWGNSETAKLTPQQFTNVHKLCDKFCNLPDLDKTGIQQGHELAMTYLDIHTIELPKELMDKRDFRGNPCKDVRDYFRFWGKKAFADLVKTALPYRFWDQVPEFNRKGEMIGFGYQFNNTQCYNFLQKNGFYRIKSDNSKDGYIFIRIDGNIVSEIEGNEIKNFINNFLKERKSEIKLRNTFYRSTQLGSNSLSNLDQIEIDFTDFDKDCQFIFLKNRTWKVTKNGIEDFRPGEIDKFVWQDEVIDHQVKLLEEPFSIKQLPTGEFDIEIKNKSCMFFRYLINTSRVHWREELETRLNELKLEDREAYKNKYQWAIDGSLLTEEEIMEQKAHLVNKIYALGYLLHRYKDPSRPWCVYAMDWKVSEEGESHGGSGKSIALKAPRVFMKNLVLDGRNPKLTDNAHIYEQVNHHTDYIMIDDCNQYIKFDFFFAPLTGDLTVNPKNNKQFTIPFENVPKFAMSSNFALRNIDPSTERRLLYTVFSDYYHFNKEGEYTESRNPKDEFGKTLFLDFNDEDWNNFINFMAYCLKYYMQFEKIEPPMENVTKRNLQSIMGMSFLNWADVYFAPESDRVDTMVQKHVALKSFLEETKQQWTMQKFSASMKAWAKYRGMGLNPPAFQNEQGRIVRKVDGKTVEMIYIQTKNELMTEEKDGPF